MRCLPILLLALLPLACSSPFGPDRVRVLGAIAGYNDDDPRVEVTPGVRSAVVSVTTYGGGCHEQGPTEVQIAGMAAVVTPYDYTAPPGTACTAILRSFTHQTTIPFGASDTARVLVRGLDASRRSAEKPDGDTIVVERRVLIR